MTHKELIKELRQESPGPLYLFTGPEQLLIRQAVELLKARLVDPAYADFNLTVLDGEEAAPESLFSALETLPFFQERKLIIIKDAPYFKGTQDKLSEAQRERLEGLLDQPSADTVLVFLAPQTDKRKRLSKTLSARGRWVSFDKLERPDYEKWLQKQAEAAGLKSSASELKYLAEVTGYLDRNSDLTLLDIHSDLERLFSLIGEGPLTRSRIDTVFQKPLEYSIFAMGDHIAEGNPSKALAMLRELQQDGEAEIKILFMIARHYRILLRFWLYGQDRLPEKELAAKAGVQPFLVKKYTQQAGRIGYPGLKEALELILETDRAMKTGRLAPDTGLELLMIRLAHRNPAGAQGISGGKHI